MPRNKEKIERNKIREKYAREFASKIAKKDADIRALCQKNDELRAEIKRLEEKSALDNVTIQRLDELVKTLQKWTELSDKDLEAMKADLESHAKLMSAAKDMDRTLSGMTKAFGGLPSGYAMQSMLYDMLGGGLLSGIASRDGGR